MVRLQGCGQLPPSGSADQYLTSVQEYLPYLCKQQDGAAEAGAPPEPDAGREAHAALLQQLSARTPQLSDGTQLYDRVANLRLMPIGVQSLDSMIGGGLKETTVTEIAGETSSGKTQLCLLAAVMTAQRSERVYYFDTTNSFSAARLQQLSEATGPEELKAVLDNITVVTCHSIHALLSSLNEIAQQASTTAPNVWPKLVIIDSMSALLSPLVGASQHNQGHVLVAETARLLRHTADALQCSVLVTNHVVGAGSGGFAAGREEGSGSSTRAGGVNLAFKPALGEQWRGAPHVRLQLSRAGGDLVCATLLTYAMRGPGLQAWFALGEQLRSQGPC